MKRGDLLYTPYYCEENAWHLVQEPGLGLGTRYVLFVSNAARTCAMWFQRAAGDPQLPVVWDYHVVVVVEGPQGTHLWDLDTLLPLCSPLDDWLARTFWATPRIAPDFAPRFRLVAADDFVARFDSDRSHMLDAQGHYREPPPTWAAIHDDARTPNLSEFIDVDAEFIGERFDLEGLGARFA